MNVCEHKKKTGTKSSVIHNLLEEFAKKTGAEGLVQGLDEGLNHMIVSR